MVRSKAIWTLFLLLLNLGYICGSVRRICKFPAIYNFGDSNSDTGARSAALEQLLSPNGETFFGVASGRFCDGRLVIDFMGSIFLQVHYSSYKLVITQNFKLYYPPYCSGETEVALLGCVSGLTRYKF